MKLKEYVNMHRGWEKHLKEGDDWHSDEHETLADKKYADSQASDNSLAGADVKVVSGGLAGASGEVMEMTTTTEGEPAVVVFLHRDADSQLMGKAGDEVIAKVSDVEVDKGIQEAVHGIEVGQTVTHKQEPEMGKGRVVAASKQGGQPVILVMWESGQRRRHDPRSLQPEGGYAVREAERAPYQRRNDERTLRDIADLHKRCKVLSQLTEGDARAYIDDAAHNLYQAAEDIRYQAEISEDTKKNLNEGDFIGHHAEIDGKMYVDSNFLNSVRKIRDTFPNTLESMGFGEFYLKTPKGRIDFDRMRGQDFPGMVGRSHQLSSEPPELADELINAMEQAGASETPQPSEEPPPGMPMQENLDSDSLHDALLDFIYQQLPEGDLESATPAILQALQSAIETINSPEANPHDGEMYEGQISRKDFMKMVREELQDEINKQIEPETEDNFDMDTLRSMVREEVGGLINNYKKSLEEADEGGWTHHDIFNMPEPEAVESTGDPKEDAIREIVASQSMGRVEGVKLDLYSASAIVYILDAISPQNKEKYMAMPVDKMASIAFKMMK